MLARQPLMPLRPALASGSHYHAPLPRLLGAQNPVVDGKVCGGCGQKIVGKMLTCEGKTWHQQCFVCHLCQKPILKDGCTELSYTKTSDGKCACFDCGADTCSGCGQQIRGETLTCEGKKWHRQCFICGLCREPILKEGCTDLSYSKTPDGKCACWDCGNGGKPKCVVDSANMCSGCGKKITGEMLTCEGKLWHRRCFLCGLCQKPIVKEGSADTSYAKTPDGKCACWDCSAFGKPSCTEEGANVCSGCGKSIVGEWLTCEGKMWHRQCFACELCRRPIFKAGCTDFSYVRDSKGRLACSDCNCSQPCGNICNGCGEKIVGETLTCENKVWHPQCFTGDLCQKPVLKKGLSNFNFVKTLEGKPACPDCACTLQHVGTKQESRDIMSHEGKVAKGGTIKITFSHSAFIHNNAGNISDYYDIAGAKLGEGTFGCVSVCSNKTTGVTRAVKSMAKAHMTQKVLDSFQREIEIMKLMDHPNIIKLFETFEGQGKIYLILELCSGGELFDRIIDEGHFTEVQAATVMQNMFRAIFYLHGRHICHRDLKPENFLFTTKDPIENSALKLIDFGLACECSPTQCLTTKVGTCYYVSPQVLAGKYDLSADMWSLGVIMYIILCGYPPFGGDTDEEIIARVRQGEWIFEEDDWKYVSLDAQVLIRKLLKMNVRERCTAEQAVNHVWVKNKAPKATDVSLQSSLVDNLRSFRSQNKLKKAALHVVASLLGEKEIESLRDIFMALDVKGRGVLTINDMKDGLSRSGLKRVPSDLQQIIEEVDSDGSGFIDYTEFLAAALDKKLYMTEDVCWQAFCTLDRNGDGKIDRQEIQLILQNADKQVVPEQSLTEIMQDVDKNGDGEIDFQEFMHMMRGGC